MGVCKFTTERSDAPKPGAQIPLSVLKNSMICFCRYSNLPQAFIYSFINEGRDYSPCTQGLQKNPQINKRKNRCVLTSSGTGEILEWGTSK